MSDVYVLVEYTGTTLDPITAELITAARVFGQVSAVVVGTPGTTDGFADELAALGAEEIIAAEDESVAHRFIVPQVDALTQLATQDPAPIVMEAGVTGNELAGRTAVNVGSGVLFNLVELHADGTANGSIFGDRYKTYVTSSGQTPVYAVSPGMIEADPKAAAGQRKEIELGGPGPRDVEVTGFSPAVASSRPSLNDATIVVAGGRALGSAEEFERLVGGLADELGAAVGATRDAVDLKYVGPHAQIGQTGQNVSPHLYIGLGISGAIHHLSGMQTAKKIVAVNQDEDAAIFEVSDLGIVGDLFEIVPELIETLRENK